MVYTATGMWHAMQLCNSLLAMLIKSWATNDIIVMKFIMFNPPPPLHSLEDEDILASKRVGETTILICFSLKQTLIHSNMRNCSMLSRKRYMTKAKTKPFIFEEKEIKTLS